MENPRGGIYYYASSWVILIRADNAEADSLLQAECNYQGNVIRRIMMHQKRLYDTAQTQVIASGKWSSNVRYLLVFLCLVLLFITAVPAKGYEGVNTPWVSPKIAAALETAQRLPVLIKLRNSSDDPFTHRSTESSDNAHFISRSNVRQLQKAIETTLSREIINKDFEIIHKLHAIPWITGTITPKALERLKRDPNVAFILEDIPVTASLRESRPLIGAGYVHFQGDTRRGVNVAVLDTGIDASHPALMGSVAWEECFLGAGTCPNGSGTRASGAGSAADGNGHGTHVAGIIASSDSNYRGINPNAGIVAVKVLDDSGSGRISDVLAALDWVTANKDAFGIRVVNMSFGAGTYPGNCDSYFPAVADAALAAKTSGITVFASSGNNGSASFLSTPACISSVISVGAVYDSDMEQINWGICSEASISADQIACFSNTSPSLDLLAPGALIDSTWPGGIFATAAGTSAASPHAAALAARMIAKNNALLPDAVLKRMKRTGLLIHDSRINLEFPRIDAVSALDFPQMVTIGDINANGYEDIAVVITDLISHSISVFTVDSITGESIQTNNIGNYTFIDIKATPNAKTNNISNIALLLYDHVSGAFFVLIRDTLTGSVLRVDFDKKIAAQQLFVLPDTSGGAYLLGVFGMDQNNGAAILEIRNAYSGILVSDIYFDKNFTPVSAIALPDINSNAYPEIGVLAIDKRNGNVRVQIKDAQSGIQSSNIYFDKNFVPVTAITLPDINGNAYPEIGVLAIDKRNGNVRVQIKDTHSRILINNIYFGESFTPVMLTSIPDSNLNRSKLAVLEEDFTSGNVQLKIRDPLTKALILNITVF